MFFQALMYFLIFALGFLSCMFFIYLMSSSEIGRNFEFNLSQKDVEAPGDWIELSQIIVDDEKIVINIENASLSSYAPTGSMKPLLDEGANGIRVVPENSEQVNIGDIVTYSDEKIVHRVIEKGEDKEGVWFITQGDNNTISGCS